ncbi:phosphatidate cytidylyltransferase [Thermoactinomyces mirandus]|uniref:Phosphatidate cytidylyltransferase n=1 Tax=Thermoactinomyces mirandus TaxID=2756294 RepID=A0A7W1XSW2_9BACL|nr:phosphatidate cytidylyltransferase [Thermoactinomyces mirandus]MBA4602537.1 phosphatidate cytidylyltransferase [Thermoactinomyces mirandus]
MKQRIITGILGAVIFLVLMSQAWLYTFFLFFLGIVAFIEYAKMKHISIRTPQIYIGMILVTMFFFSGLANRPMFSDFSFLKGTTPVIFGLILYFLWIVLSRNRFDLFQMSYLFVGSLYIGYGFSYMMLTIWKENGLAWSLLIVFATWANDTGAYFIGKKWGKQKLWPEISPNKTIEGSLGGILSGTFLSVVIFFIFPDLGDPVLALGLGVLITIVGQIGDLVESAWKRSTGVKDSGTFLPGHGGFLDRFDSLLFTFMILHLVEVL